MTRWLTPEQVAEQRARVARYREQTLGELAQHTPAKKSVVKSVAQSTTISNRVYPIVWLCRQAGLREPIPEWTAKPRRWRFDYAWPTLKLALEIEGGLWTNGRHSRGTGAIADICKYSEAAILGWRILYATPEETRSGMAMSRILRAMGKLPIVGDCA